MADSRKISEMPAKASLVDADDIAIVDSEVADPVSPLKNKRVSQSVAFATLAKQSDFDNHVNDDARHLTAVQNDALDAADNPSGANEFLTRSGGDAQYDALGAAAGVQANLDTHKTSNDHDGRYYTESEVDALIAQRVAKAGDTMTGPLTLPGNPTQNLQAATKQYVDAVGVGTFLHADLTDTALDGHPGSAITIAGGGTGNAVTIAADDSLEDAGFAPETAGAAAAVQANLDTHKVAADQHPISGVTGLAAALPTADQKAALDANPALNAGNPVAAQDQIVTEATDLKSTGQPAGKIIETDGTSGFVYADKPSGGGTDELVKVSATDQVAQYLLAKLFSGDASVTFTQTDAGATERIDVRATGAGGGEANTGENIGVGLGWYAGMNGTILQFRSVANKSSIAWTLNVDVLEADVQFGTGAGVAAEGNHLHPGVYDPAGSAAAVQTNLDTHKTSNDHDGRYYTEAEVDSLVAARVAKAGDTMTGLLVLSGDPIAPLGAVTKQYADALGGGWADGTTVNYWELGVQNLGNLSSNPTVDLNNGQHITAATNGADRTINFTSGASIPVTQWTATVDLGSPGDTINWTFDSVAVNLTDGYDISAGGVFIFSFTRDTYGVTVSERGVA